MFLQFASIQDGNLFIPTITMIIQILMAKIRSSGRGMVTLEYQGKCHLSEDISATFTNNIICDVFLNLSNTGTFFAPGFSPIV